MSMTGIAQKHLSACGAMLSSMQGCWLTVAAQYAVSVPPRPSKPPASCTDGAVLLLSGRLLELSLVRDTVCSPVDAVHSCSVFPVVPSTNLHGCVCITRYDVAEGIGLYSLQAPKHCKLLKAPLHGAYIHAGFKSHLKGVNCVRSTRWKYAKQLHLPCAGSDQHQVLVCSVPISLCPSHVLPS